MHANMLLDDEELKNIDSSNFKIGELNTDNQAQHRDLFGEFEEEDLLDGITTPPENQYMDDEKNLDGASALSTPMFNKNQRHKNEEYNYK